jgi:hypothetical protein
MMSSRRLRSWSPEDARGLLVRFENRMFIDKPIGEVFAFLADFRNVPLWNYHVRSVEKQSEGPIGVGTRFRQARRSDEQRFTITEFEPPRIISVRTDPDSMPAFEMRYRLCPEGDGTALSDAWELDTVKHRLLARLLGRRAAREAAINLYRLKELLEMGATTLQDGRTVSLRAQS